MMLNKLLVANLMIGITVLIQGTVPMGHISGYGDVWMFSAAVFCMVIAVIVFIALLILSRSNCILTMSKVKMAIFFSPAVVTSLFSLVFFIVYTFVAEASVNHPAIQNAMLLLVVASSLILLFSLIILLLALLTNNDIPSEKGEDDE